MKLEKEEERKGEMMRRKVVIRFPIDPMSEALVEVNQTIKASAELVAKETAIERVPVVEEEAKVDKEDEGQTRELQEEGRGCCCNVQASPLSPPSLSSVLSLSSSPFHLKPPS